MIYISPLYAPETPVILPDGSWLCVEMDARRGCVTHISADCEHTRVIARTGRPNGLVVDTEGVIWVAESLHSSLLRVTMDGKVETWLTECDGRSFIFPNDLVFGPDGLLYMTDSGVIMGDFLVNERVREDYARLKYDGRVYQIDLRARRVRQLDSGIKFTNGIAWGQDGCLYANETMTGLIFRYEWKNGAFRPREVFTNVIDPAAPPGWKGPDGMKFGLDGNLYCTVYSQGDVTVINPQGVVIQRIKTDGKFPTNLTFGANHEKRIYVTEIENNAIEVHDVETEGLPGFWATSFAG